MCLFSAPVVLQIAGSAHVALLLSFYDQFLVFHEFFKDPTRRTFDLLLQTAMSADFIYSKLLITT